MDRLSPISPSEVLRGDPFHAPHWAKVVDKYGTIDSSMAQALADGFNNSPGFWLGMQCQYDAELARDLLDKDG